MNINEYNLVWNDEFDYEGKLDSKNGIMKPETFSGQIASFRPILTDLIMFL